MFKIRTFDLIFDLLVHMHKKKKILSKTNTFSLHLESKSIFHITQKMGNLINLKTNTNN